MTNMLPYENCQKGCEDMGYTWCAKILCYMNELFRAYLRNKYKFHRSRQGDKDKLKHILNAGKKLYYYKYISDNFKKYMKITWKGI